MADKTYYVISLTHPPPNFDGVLGQPIYVAVNWDNRLPPLAKFLYIKISLVIDNDHNALVITPKELAKLNETRRDIAIHNLELLEKTDYIHVIIEELE